MEETIELSVGIIHKNKVPFLQLTWTNQFLIWNGLKNSDQSTLFLYKTKHKFVPWTTLICSVMSLNGSEFPLNHLFVVTSHLWSTQKDKDKNLLKSNSQIYLQQKNKPFIPSLKNYNLLLMNNKVIKITNKVNFGTLLQ